MCHFDVLAPRGRKPPVAPEAGGTRGRCRPPRRSALHLTWGRRRAWRRHRRRTATRQVQGGSFRGALPAQLRAQPSPSQATSTLHCAAALPSPCLSAPACLMQLRGPVEPPAAALENYFGGSAGPHVEPPLAWLRRAALCAWVPPASADPAAKTTAVQRLVEWCTAVLSDG